jgi:hypothetical protein
MLTGIAPSLCYTKDLSKPTASPQIDQSRGENVNNQDRIQPHAKNPFYWQYRGQPVLLLGGSVEDNLFQIPHIEEHLDLLQSVGGNYVRCTMSSRDPGNVWPYEQDPASGLYDLATPSTEYWSRFSRFLALAAERDIIAQFEMWDRFDFARAPWNRNPYNPKNNVNYTAAQSGLKETIETHPGRCENDFFHTVPSLQDNALLLQYQQHQVDTMLAISLHYGNVLYCMDNETNDDPEWSWYWARYIRDKASQAGVGVEMTEMWDAHNLLDGEHGATFDHPELYSFVDISQNNHRPPDEHWANPQQIRQRLITSGHVRPMNSVKIYGANSGHYGSTRDAQERFWRNIFGGLASSRFHRPPSGLGLKEIAQSHIQSMRMFTNEIELYDCEPHNDLLHNNSWNEAYCTAHPGVTYGVFFPDGGNVRLDVSAAAGHSISVRWLDIRKWAWTGEPVPCQPEPQGSLPLITPAEEGYWAALVQVSDQAMPSHQTHESTVISVART